MYGYTEYGEGLRMRVRIGPILTTIITTGAGNTMKVTGIMTTTAPTTIGITTIANLLTGPGQKPGPACRGHSSVFI